MQGLIGCLATVLWTAPTTAQEGATTVEGLVAALGEAPPPVVGEGAPNYSPEQTASILCDVQSEENWTRFRRLRPDADTPSPATLRAQASALHQATLQARDVRVRAFLGEATRAQMERAERQRQAAVRRFAPESTRGADLPGPTYEGLTIAGLSGRRAIENGRAVLLVTGTIRNADAIARELPPITISTLDFRGFLLAAQTGPLDHTAIGPGEAQTFTVRFKNPPRYVTELKAHFGEPFGVRNFRGCEFLDPLSFDPQKARVEVSRAATAPVPVPVPKVGPGAPAYTPDELAAMVRVVRADARSAFSEGPVLTIPLPAAVPGPLPQACGLDQAWRPLMILADLMEEAWIATTAAEEVRRDAARGVFLPDEVEAAELARQTAVRAVLTARPPPLTVRPDVRKRFDVQRLGHSGDGFVSVRGQVMNTGDETARVQPLLVTVKDRYGFVLSQRVLQSLASVAPRQVGPFSINMAIPAELVGEVTVVPAC